ncbi:hypothetical protein [Cyanothece sp. BG0011]|uniref:hypothetical protein n=1 Tax=Cyanothece sp. BG0011 TaxID=2082950 RepID=UPI0018E55D68|nr:hypothetical protein [Cyanothece sp. BG0011]
MTNITISNLDPNNTGLFMNSESFITELTDEQLNDTHGGGFWFGVAVGLAIAHVLR